MPLSDYNTVVGAEVPQQTDTYTPVSNQDMVELLRDQIKIFLSEFFIKDEIYYLSSDEKRMLAKFVLTAEGITGDNLPLCILIKNSYDKSTATAIGTGAGIDDSVWLRTSDITLFRKHTKKVLPSLSRNIAESLDSAGQRYEELTSLVKIMKKVPCSDDHAFALFGIARGQGVIGARAMNDAFKTWAKDDKDEVKNLWDVSTSILKYVETRGEPKDMMEAAGKVGTVVECLPEIFNIQED